MAPWRRIATPVTAATPLAPMLGSLAVILLLLAGVAVLARRLRGRHWAGRLDQPIKIVASRALGWQSCLLIVEAGGRRFLVGSSRAGLTAIGALDAAPPPRLEP